jgi:hypothetical protein
MNLFIDKKQLDGMGKACILMFVMLKEDDKGMKEYRLVQNHYDSADVPPGKIVELTIRMLDELPEVKPVPLVAEMELMPA